MFLFIYLRLTFNNYALDSSAAINADIFRHLMIPARIFIMPSIEFGLVTKPDAPKIESSSK